MLKTTVVTITILCAATQAAAASPAVALVGDRTLALFDTEKPTIVKRIDVDGVTRLDGIDWQPSTGHLVGVETKGDIVTIDPETGKTKLLVRMDVDIPTGETPVIVDFNPATGSIRLMTGTTNYRVDPETGTVTTDSQLAYVDNDKNSMTLPMVVAAAYTNAFGAPDTTALYGIDTAAGALVRQTMPNDGALKTIGPLEIEKADSYGFDIETAADGTNTAWLVAGNTLYIIDLETGKATASGEIEGLGGLEERIRDFSVIGPEPKSAM